MLLWLYYGHWWQYLPPRWLLVKRGVFNDNEAVSILSRIRGSTALADLAGCELVVEAATENAQIKEQIFRQLADAVPADTLLASNRFLSFQPVASSTKRRFLSTLLSVNN